MEGLNRIKLHIEKDGVITVDSDAFEEELHLSAEKFLKEVFEAAGGEHKVIENKRPDIAHVHHTDKAHSHG
jgi:hypothetical protein